MVGLELLDPGLLLSQVPVYFTCGVVYAKLKRIDAAVMAVETCPVCQSHRYGE
jgi:hypothetical protein